MSMKGKSEKEKMLAGELYNPLDPRLSADRRQARLLLKALNDTSDDQQEERDRLIKELIPKRGHGCWIEPPFIATTAAISRSETKFISILIVLSLMLHQ